MMQIWIISLLVLCLQASDSSRMLDSVEEGSLEDQVLDLTPFINTSAVKVDESFSLERAYVVLRTLGLRHLIVVDINNCVQGIVTRKVSSSPNVSTEFIGYTIHH